MITIKDQEIASVLSVAFDETLIDILLYLELLYPNRVLITCGHRPGDHGVHGQIPCRGIDIRSRVFSKPAKIAQIINERWKYDYARPEKQVAILHGEGYNEHLHIQTHPNTLRKEK